MTQHADRIIEAKADQLRALDTTLIDTIQNWIDLTKDLGNARIDAGHPRTVHQDELAFIRGFRSLGAAGAELAVVLLRLSRTGLDSPQAKEVSPADYRVRRTSTSHPSGRFRDGRPINVDAELVGHAGCDGACAAWPKETLAGP
ncbi:hypothetical protein ATK36_0810 [Amycolatopsis sulphurea]|uniref:Chorismate mutase n=1 Tax=Amycolatopsis sulphurea TaxID=76022 RepID=A0A2A9G3C7_9PSEU|nr:hypothetical protein [Amycolatopsis sulphurea]PFG57245.1 hypothetical protein ATK36_0810 [Amycolatopsis sulphurea]